MTMLDKKGQTRSVAGLYIGRVESRESASQSSLPGPSAATKLKWGGGNAESIKESSAPGRCCW